MKDEKGRLGILTALASRQAVPPLAGLPCGSLPRLFPEAWLAESGVGLRSQ